MKQLELSEICGANWANVGEMLRPLLGRLLGGDYSPEVFEQAGVLASVANNLFDEELQPLFEAGSLATLAAMGQVAAGGERWHELRCLRAILMACHKGKDAYAPGAVDKAEELFFDAKHSEQPLDTRAVSARQQFAQGASESVLIASLSELSGLYYGLKKEAQYREWMVEVLGWCVGEKLPKGVAPAVISLAVHTEGTYDWVTVRNLTGVEFLPTWMQSWYLHQASADLVIKLKQEGLHPKAAPLTRQIFEIICGMRGV